MGDIELVIKINEDIYEARKSWVGNPMRLLTDLDSAVADGIVLPKGHGRLIDADAVLEDPIGNTYRDIDIAETILEADDERKGRE